MDPRPLIGTGDRDSTARYPEILGEIDPQVFTENRETLRTDTAPSSELEIHLTRETSPTGLPAFKNQSSQPIPFSNPRRRVSREVGKAAVEV